MSMRVYRHKKTKLKGLERQTVKRDQEGVLCEKQIRNAVFLLIYALRKVLYEFPTLPDLLVLVLFKDH